MKKKTKKVVINRDYGGFSLSMKAVSRLAELKGKKAYFFNIDLKGHSYTPYDGNSFVWAAFSVPNPNDYASGKKWADMNKEERIKENKSFESICIENRPRDREDKDLVRVVEELGKESWGTSAHLAVVKIPDDVEYEISEYDGLEHIAEKHRTWG